jgi:hypothetical protein
MSTIGIQSTANQCQSNGLSGAVRRRQIHQDVEDDAHERHRHEDAERRIGCDIGGGGRFRGRSTAIQDAAAGPDNSCRRDAQTHDAERAMRRTAMPPEIIERSAGGRHDVDIRRVRGEEQRGRRAAAGAPERRARQRQREQAVRQIIQSR